MPTLQCTLQYMGHAQKVHQGTQTFPISKLGGWKHTTAFHKSPKTNRHQAFKHRCHENRQEIGYRGRLWTFRNWGDTGLPPASRESTQTSMPPKHYTKLGVITSVVIVKERGNIPVWVSDTIRVQV